MCFSITAGCESTLHTYPRAPFVSAMNDTRGQMYNAETLELFAVFLRQSTPKGKTKTDVLSADAVSGYVSAIRIYRSREARYEEGAGDVTGLYLRYQGELLGLWDPQCSKS